MWKLDYDDALLLYIPAETTIDLQNSSFYKLSLRRYVYEIRTGFLQFKSTLTYLDFKRIILLCEQESKKKGFSLVVSPSLRVVKFLGRVSHLRLDVNRVPQL